MRPAMPIFCALALMLALPALGVADEREPGKPKVEPTAWRMPAEDKAAAFLAAFKAEDAARQAEIGPGFSPDPWLVAETLCNLGEHDAARAFARVAHDKAVEKLPAYIDGRAAEDPERTKAIRAGYDTVRAARKAFSADDYRTMVSHAMRIELPSDSVTGNLGANLKAVAFRLLGRMSESVGLSIDAAKAAREMGWIGGALTHDMAIGQGLIMSGDVRGALKALRVAERDANKIGNKRLAAAAISNQGNVYYVRAQYDKALKLYERSIEMKQVLGDKRGAARTLANVGGIHLAMGRYADALSTTERALVTFDELKDMHAVMQCLGNLGNIYSRIGNLDRALGYLDQAERYSKKVGDKRSLAMTRLNIAVTWETSATGRGDDEEGRKKDFSNAARYLRLAREASTSIGDARLDVRIALAEASLASHAGDGNAQLAAADALEAAAKKIEDRKSRLSVFRVRATAHRLLGDLEASARASERAASEARRIRMKHELALALGELAQTRFLQKNYEAALRHAAEAMEAAEASSDQLGDDEAALARSQFARVYDVGIAAAAELGEVDESLRLMEQSRAGSMLQSLGGKRELRWAMQKIPEEMRDSEEHAVQAEAQARMLYERGARRRLPPAKLRELSEALQAAEGRVQAVRGRIQREAMRSAGLFYPKAASTIEVQDALADDEAMVVFGVANAEAYAVVLTVDDERLVSLGSWTNITAALEGARISDDTSKPGDGIASLKELLIAPLELPETVTQVIISPAAELTYAPWSLLLDRGVALAPSATTHVHLRDQEQEPAKGVLAIGDPDYAGEAENTRKIYVRGHTLTPLPGSRAEAKAVGTTVLLGAAATPAALREAMGKQERWRAAHFACHGLINPTQPTLCALALSAGKDGSSGFLTALDVLGMDIPADLAVLSACETGLGTVSRGEGMRGLARAFMQAGAPRVIASLWKVDDEATRALMVKFYELWNPKEGKGLPPAEALRKAQAHVRSQEKWQHPYYWAAWVLWGLPR